MGQVKLKSPFRKVGRKTPPRGALSPNSLLNEDLTDRFCKLIRRGMPFADICDYLGIDYGTFLKWRARGEAARGGMPSKRVENEEGVYLDFVLKTRRAFAVWKLRRIDRLHHSSNWVREMAILERRDRAHFGRQEQAGGDDEQYDPDEKFL